MYACIGICTQLTSPQGAQGFAQLVTFVQPQKIYGMCADKHAVACEINGNGQMDLNSSDVMQPIKTHVVEIRDSGPCSRLQNEICIVFSMALPPPACR